MPYRLKSLELNGYKTFATKTVFEFGESITAVVGPNGSGKSNIADAIRWVLGEQSYRLLRGRKTDDMIFSGSETRPRAGMASAAIVFDNSDGWLPIDYSEVSIARRAYRDGQNEYLVNNQKVRLRDVTEMLSNSGLSERTYTVIGQGLVDAALSLRADERRGLFEEAAGIGLYRSRKEQALRRLEATRRNLERVQDILAELKPRLRSLERQARRAQEHEQLAEDLREILREWYGYHWHRTQRELRAAREVAEAQERTLEKARRSQEALSQEMAAARDQITRLRGRLNSWHRQLSQLHSDRETASRDLAVGDERRRSLSEQRQNLETERTRLGEELTRQRERLQQAASEVEKLEAEAAEYESQMQDARQTLQERQGARRSAENALQRAEERIKEIDRRHIELSAAKAELEARLDRQHGSEAELKETVAKFELELRSAEEHLREADEGREKAEAEAKVAEGKLTSLREQIDRVADQRRAKSDALTAKQAQVARLQAQLEVLEAAERTLAGYAEGARLLLQAARAGRLSGNRGALSEHLEVPEELERAISAALGEYADAILLGENGALEQALILLEEAPARAALLPLDRLSPISPLAPPRGEGCLGVASDLVKAPAHLRPAVDLLLGQVLVVRDRQAAQQALVGQSAGVRAATLRGEVFSQSGAVLVDGARERTALGRPRRRRELSRELAEIEAEATRLEEQIEADHRLKEALLAEKEELEAALRRQHERLEERREARRNYSLEVQDMRRQQEWRRRQADDAQSQASEARQAIRQFEGESARLAAERTQIEDSLNEQRASLSEQSLDEFLEQVAHWEKLVAVSRQALAGARLRMEEQQAVVDKTEEREESLVARLESLESQQGDLDAQIEGLRRSEGEVREEIASLGSLIEPAETELRAAEQEHERLLAEEAETRQAMNVAERHHSQAQLGLARQQEALEALRRRIEDDFGLVAFDYDESVSGPRPLPLGDLVERLPLVTVLPPELEATLKRQRAQLRRMGSINPEAQAEHEQVRERFEFMTAQVADLTAAEADIRQVIAELDALMENEFRQTFEVVAREFREIFSRLFGGGSARLVLTDEEDLTSTGIDIETRLPGKRAQGLASLSGGERSLTAAALVFALLKASPTPFCVMDEVDAMLDEANIARFRDLLEELSGLTQFVIITHNRGTVQAAEVIYGITMGRDTASRVISLKLDEVDERFSE